MKVESPGAEETPRLCGLLVQHAPVPEVFSPDLVVRSPIAVAIPDVTLEWFAIGRYAKYSELGSENEAVVWLILKGSGVFESTVNQTVYRLSAHEEAIAHMPVGSAASIAVPRGQSLLALRIGKQLSDEDRSEYTCLHHHNSKPRLRYFSTCPSYSEAIKTASTTSRTLLPETVVPRMAIGTVEAHGPNRVELHRHPMLEQVFVGLCGNSCTVIADEASVSFPEFSVIHIPLGSLHGAAVQQGSELRYVWIDFFRTKKDQSWLEGHIPDARVKSNGKI